MKNNKGFTLIEVIISIALLGIICIGMLSAMTSQYSLMVKSREITQNLFEAQQLIEQNIEKIKQGVKNGTPPVGLVRTPFVLFDGVDQRTVYGYPNTAEINHGKGILKLYTVTADMTMPEFDVPTATNVMINFSNGVTIPYAYRNTPSLQVKSQFTKVDPKNVFLTSINRWYVSRVGFNIPTITNPIEIEKGTIYPRFPEDYTLITGAITKDLTTIANTFAGRHLIYTITPAAVSGKMGQTEISNPVFLSGLPVITNLKVHLDASMVSKEDTTAVRKVITTSGGVEVNSYYVKKWKDVSGNLSFGIFADQNTDTKQPELIETKIGTISSDGKEYDTYAKFLRFTGSQGLSIADSNHFDIDDITVIAVARSTETDKGMSIISKIRNAHDTDPSWNLGWDMNEDNKLFFGVRLNKNKTSNVQGDLGFGLDGGWHVLAGTSQYSNSSRIGKSTLQIDDGSVYEVSRDFGNLVNNSDITIGFDGNTSYSTVDIAEILIYEGVLSSADLGLVQAYLKNKYQPIAPVVSLYALKPLTDTVIKGEIYPPLPTNIPAYMSNSTMQNVAVTWSPNTLVTTSIGKIVSTATAVMDSTKTTTLTVDVVGIVSVDDMYVTIEKGETYTLPTKVPAKLSNGTTKDVEVTWDNITPIDTNTLGVKAPKIGTVALDNSKTMKLVVTVVEVGVKGVGLNKTTTTLDVNMMETLIANVSPVNASDKTVTWSSSDESVATVSSGVVTGKAKGTATIMVTTKDGGFTASCAVTVVKPVTGISLNKDTTTINKNNLEKLIATIIPADSSNLIVTWVSDNTGVATVSVTGEVTAVAVGTAHITATSAANGAISDMCTVTVDDPMKVIQDELNKSKYDNLTVDYSTNKNSNPNKPTIKLPSSSIIGIVCTFRSPTATGAASIDPSTFVVTRDISDQNGTIVLRMDFHGSYIDKTYNVTIPRNKINGAVGAVTATE